MKRLISLLLVLSLLLTGCSLSPSASSAVSSLPPAQNSLTGERPLLQRKDIAFSEMVFVRPDLEETIAACREFAPLRTKFADRFVLEFSIPSRDSWC